MTSKLKAKNVRQRMQNITYINLILFMMILVTMINLYYKPNITPKSNIFNLFEEKKSINPIIKSNCSLQGFKCPSEELCDCNNFCSNGNEFMPFLIEKNEQVFVMDKKLTPGMYCLPKGVDKCNLKTNYQVLSLAGWSCLSLNEMIFKEDKKRACKNEEAEDNNLNVLWDYLTNQEAEYGINDYYEHLKDGKLRYRCVCGSKSIDGTRMISILPFTCFADYCLRNIPKPYDFMGWNGENCECGPYFHLNPNDKKSPCRKEISRIHDDVHFTGKVDCMTEKSFLKHALFCPNEERELTFKEFIKNSSNVQEFVDTLKNKAII